MASPLKKVKMSWHKIRIMSGIYLLLPAAFFLAGLLPLVLWNRHKKVNYNIYLLGWMAWFCAVSVKTVISTFEILYWPSLFSDDLLLVLNATALESIEVISAFLFLAYHHSIQIDAGRWWICLSAPGSKPGVRIFRSSGPFFWH